MKKKGRPVMQNVGRARTPIQKREVVEDLLAAWNRFPELRFGQLLHNVTGQSSLYFIEDTDLADRALDFSEE